MLDTSVKGPTPQQGRDVEMIDVPAEGTTLKEGIMDVGLDHRIFDSNSQETY